METYCQRLTESLAKNNEVEVIALHGQANGRPPSTLNLLTFPFTVACRWLEYRQQFNIVHLGDMAIWPFALLRLLFSRNARTVLSAHGTDISFSVRGGFKGNIYGLYQRLGAKLLGNAIVIANSEATANACRKHGWSNVSTVALATDLEAKPRREYSRTQILFAGRLVKRKGLAWFVQNVLPELPGHLELEVAGISTDPKESLALQYPRVRYLGGLDQQELSEKYSKALCVIVPNIDLSNGEFEGFGLVACEAASSGGLVLAAATGGLTSAVINGETGILLPAGDSPAWIKTITEVANWSDKQRADFLDNAHNKARSHYNWERVAFETQDAYPSTERSGSAA